MSTSVLPFKHIARRYAKALFDLATQKKALDNTADEVATLSRIFEASPELAAVLRSPVVSLEGKKNVMAAILKKAKASKIFTSFCGTVAASNRLQALPAILATFQEMVDAENGAVEATLTSAVKMPAAQKKALLKTLEKDSGGHLKVVETVDKDLLAGFTVKLGSKFYDASMKTRLNNLQSNLKQPIDLAS